MADDAFQATQELGKSMELVSKSAEGLAVAFGEASDASKGWNIISRILSGSGLWKLQNRIRAVGNILSMYNNFQNEAAKATIQAAEANMKLHKSLEVMKKGAKFSLGGMAGMSPKEKKAFLESDAFQLFKQLESENIKFKKMGNVKAKRAAEAQVRKMYGGQVTALEGAQAAANAGPGRAMQYIRSGTLRDKGMNLRDTDDGGWLKQDTKWFYRRQRKTWKKRWKMLTDKDERGKKKKALFAKLGSMKNVIGRFFQVGLSFAMKGLYYFLIISVAITAIVFLFKKIKLGEQIAKIREKFDFFGLALRGLIEMAKGFFGVFKAMFTGDMPLLMRSFKKMIWGAGKFIVGLIGSLFTVLLALVGGIMRGMLNGLVKILNKLPFVDIKHRFASGGVSSGGMALVGERGPEFVNLPRGSRVYSNAQSRSMGGNTIHVHINGRVGASDAEIRDIANKVAKHINLRMNRTGATAGRF